MTIATTILNSSIMMATTHLFVSVAITALAAPLLSETVAAPLVVTAALLGGVAPDFDVVATHRKTLHFPVGYSVMALASGIITVLTPTGPLALLTVAFAAAAIHACSDVFGGSPETEPWNPTQDVAVYNHALGRWHRPRRYVRYSGAPEDFLLGAAFGGVAILAPATGPVADGALLAVLVWSGLYTLFRRRIGALPSLVSPLVPPRVRAYLPRIRVRQRDAGGSTLAFDTRED